MKNGLGQWRLSLLVGWLIVLGSALSIAWGPPELTDADAPQAPFYGYQLAQMAASVPPTITAQAAVVLDRASGKVVFDKQSRQRLAPASTTKIMTAILALERGRLADRVTVRYEQLQPLEGTDSSVMGLAPGDKLTLEDLLWGMLLPSGNDAAMVIAGTLGGSVDGFAALMNDKARALGLQDTHFVNPHGLDAADHYSSAYDLAVLARYALNDPTFARIVNTESRTLEAGRQFVLTNSNRMLASRDQYPGVDGVKTGTSDNAGECLVASGTRDGQPFIAVVLNSQNRFREAGQLLDYAFGRIERINLPLPAFPAEVDAQGTIRPLVFPARTYVVPRWDHYHVQLAVSEGKLVYRVGGQPTE